MPNPQAEKQPLNSSLHMLIQYIYSRPTNLQAMSSISNLGMHHDLNDDDDDDDDDDDYGGGNDDNV